MFLTIYGSSTYYKWGSQKGGVMDAKLATREQEREVLAWIIRKFPEGRMPAENAQYLIEHPEELPEMLLGMVSNQTNTTIPSTIIQVDWKVNWQKFYFEVFDLTVDFSGVKLADDPGGFGWEVVVTKGLTLNKVWAKCCKRFNCYSYLGDDLDQTVPKNDRQATKNYAKRFRDRVEADEENKNLSANTLIKRKVQGITLLERLLLELWYHWTTGKHLDIQCVTLCTDSRDQRGGVPAVDWSGYGLWVDGYNPDDSGDNLRTRSAV